MIMELTDVIQYAHKVKKIKITNENKQSIFSYVIIKITLDKRDDETIRFSLEPNDSFIEHQHNEYKEDANIFLNNSFEDGLEGWHTDANNYWTTYDNGLDGKAISYPQKSLRATLYQDVNLDNIKTISFYVKSTRDTDISLYLDDTLLTEENNITTLGNDIEYSEEIKEGKATINLSNISQGYHNIIVTYSGDEKYKQIIKKGIIRKDDENSNNISVIQSIADDTFTISEDGDNYTIDLPFDATGTFTISIDNEWTQLVYDVTEYSGTHKIKFLSIPKNGELLLDNFNCEFVKEAESLRTSTNDYYCRIPNKLNDISYLYAHFLPSDLYTYDNEVTDFVSFYDFREIFNDATITKNRYEDSIDSQGRLVVRSTDSTSIDGYHNPNYKQYTDIDNKKNKTEQGQFPLSSKYRSNQNWEVPDLSRPNPKWSNNTNAPKWEARIPFEDMEGPINVFINYEYLPTSREYHQHYYGFEAQETECKTINVFEGTNINSIDSAFGSENNYRLINYGNPYDDKHSFYVPHEKIIPIDLEDFTPLKNSKKEATCTWQKNYCYDYYIFTSLLTSINEPKECIKDIILEEGKYYSLRYYIFIPSYVNVENNNGYISVTVNDTTEYKIHNDFISKDKELRDQWIYHEVPFLAGEKNRIKVVGPQAVDSTIFFINIELQEMVEYSPTLQYNDIGVRLIEQDQSTFKSVAEYNDNVTCSEIKPNDTLFVSTKQELPIPYTNVNISIGNEKYAYYDPKTTNIYCVHPAYNENETHIMRYNPITTDLYGKTTDQDISFSYHNNTIYGSYNKYLTGTYGPDNIFTFYFTNMYGDYINDGTVEVGIFMSPDRDADIGDSVIKVTQFPANVKGKMEFNVDLSNLPKNTTEPDNKYYVRLKYKHKCNPLTKTVFKTLYVYEENIRIDCVQINGSPYNKQDETIIDNGYYIDDIEQFPLKITACIKDQNDQLKTTGYCELSIDDTLNQSTINDNGYVDFYLNIDDLKYGHQTIKIEYYRKYYKSICFIYFDLELKEIVSKKPYIGIDVKTLIDGKTYNISNDHYTLDIDDIAVSTITMGNHSKFRVEVYRDDTLIEKRNIYNVTDETIDFFNVTEYGDWTAHQFTIKTGNMHDENGNDIEDLYAEHIRRFIIDYK